MNALRWGMVASFVLHAGVAGIFFGWPPAEGEMPETIIPVELVSWMPATNGAASSAQHAGENGSSQTMADALSAAESPSQHHSFSQPSVDTAERPSEQGASEHSQEVPENSVAEADVTPSVDNTMMQPEPSAEKEPDSLAQDVAVLQDAPPPIPKPKDVPPVRSSARAVDSSPVSRQPEKAPSPTVRTARGAQGGVTDGQAVAASGADVTRSAEYRLGAAATPLPEYPWSARRRGKEGRVVVHLSVDVDGRPIQARIAESSGDQALDQAARETLMTWRLKPALRNGVAVASVLPVPIRFELRQATAAVAGESAGER